jgi:Fe2+ or Zn2+ uptake regulation protein
VRSPEELTERFRARGLKVTPQRQAVFRVLHGDRSHPTAEAVYAEVSRQMPTISLRTVYQTLNDLADMGELQRLDLGLGSARYDTNVEEPHQHLVCEGCGLVRDVNVDLSAVRIAHGMPSGFRVSGTDLVVRGWCRACADRGAPGVRPTARPTA